MYISSFFAYATDRDLQLYRMLREIKNPGNHLVQTPRPIYKPVKEALVILPYGGVTNRCQFSWCPCWNLNVILCQYCRLVVHWRQYLGVHSLFNISHLPYEYLQCNSTYSNFLISEIEIPLIALPWNWMSVSIHLKVRRCIVTLGS